MVPPQLFPLDLFTVKQEYPDKIVANPYYNDNGAGLDETKNVLVSLVKNDNIDLYNERTAKIYYTGKRFPSTVKLNHLYYFMPYTKKKGIRDLYLIKVARVGTKHEVRADCDDNDFRLVFEIEFLRQLFPDYKPIRLNIWQTFTDTKLRNILDM
jgi:hypothetical protein